MTIRFFTSKQEEIFNKSNIVFEPTNVDLCDSVNIYIVCDNKITNMTQNIFGSNFALYEIVNDEVLTNYSTNKIDLISNTNGKYVYKLNIIFNPLENTKHETNGVYSVVIDSQEFNFNLIGQVIQIDKQLVVTLQNFKKFMNDDYIIAFRESILSSSATDYELYNRKMREYLMNIHSLSNLHGSYKNLEAVIKFFGYGDLLELKEYWYFEDKYKSTNIGSLVLSSIDKSLIGYKKSNQMSLTYQINEQSGYDENNLPLYVNVLSNIDEVILKMYALQRILEKEFLPLNTHIVDIIGEMQGVVGFEISMLLNNTLISSTNITDNLNKPIEWEIESKDLKILNHRVIVDEYRFKEDNGILLDVSNHNFDKKYFSIYSVVGDTFEEYEMMTKYHSGNFAIAKFKYSFDTKRYQFFKYKIIKEGKLVFESKQEHIYNNPFNEGIIIGIKEEGDYRITFELQDYYGMVTYFGTDDFIKVRFEELDIVIGHYDELQPYTKRKKTPLHVYSTYDKTYGKMLNVPSSSNKNLDINTWDSVNNNPKMLIARKYAESFDINSVTTSPNQLNMIRIADLADVPMDSWSTTHTISIIEFLKSSTYKDGEQFGFKMKYINDKNFTNLTIPYNNKISRNQNIINLISHINDLKITKYIVRDFDFMLHEHGEGLEKDTTNHAIQISSQESGYPMRIVEIESITNQKKDIIYKHETDLLCTKMSEINIICNGKSNTVFYIELDGNMVFSTNKNINSNSDIITFLNTFPELYVYESKINGEPCVRVLSNSDMVLKHGSIGHHRSMVKGRQFGVIEFVEHSSDIKVGHPIFASIDSHIELGDIEWTLYDSLTGYKITEQHSIAFMYMFVNRGIYDLKCKFTHNNKNYNFDMKGLFVIK